ncbi:hypothetical protein D9611_009597 [Ephemerocybe angulata]|uniref:RNase H type-1 domain-containing protein n=1 Tax=Ephemerocybe angulata TaxID=980116 RepID=A0A8H5C809_9AGAR|nr:hypothetical protein D9611_009597 [Tulosesus angulatus]
MGGLKGLNLADKIKVIHIMRAVRFLDLEFPPRWAIITRYLLAKNIPSQYGPIDHRSAQNMYLLNWAAAKPESKSAASLFTREMIKTAEEFGLCLWTNHPSEKVKRDMPIWLHPASKKSRTASDASTYWTRCQRDKHNIHTVGEMHDFVAQLESHTRVLHEDPERSSDHDCACAMCSADEAKGCLAPVFCREQATHFLHSINQTWIPNETRDEELEKREENREGRIPKNRANTLTECFRIFTSSPPKSLTLDIDMNSPPPPPPDISRDEFTTIFTDGSGQNIGTEDACAGSGVFFGDDDPRNMAIRVPSYIPQTNNTAEALAILAAAKANKNKKKMKLPAEELVINTWWDVVGM